MTGKLPEQNLPAADGIAQEQRHGPALYLTHNGVVRYQKRYEWQKKDCEA